MDIEVVLKDEVYEEITTLMKNVDKLNNGDEIGGWLLGDWRKSKEKATLFLDEFVIPKQEVSSTEVDISPESMMDTIKELGMEKCNKIKAHWHIHPFGKGSTSWSGTDEEKIKDFMEPSKGREIFVFLLSSEGELKARVEVNFKGSIKDLGGEFTVRKTLDDLDVRKETEESNDALFGKLKARIDEKVNRRYQGGEWWKKDKSTVIQESDDGQYYNLRILKGKVRVYLDPLFADYVKECGIASTELMNPTNSKKKKGNIVLDYVRDETMLEKEFEQLDRELSMLEEQYHIYVFGQPQYRNIQYGDW